MPDNKTDVDSTASNEAVSSDVTSSNTEVVVSDWVKQDDIVKKGVKQFVAVGLALAEIRAKKLYEDGGYKTFGDYVADRIDMSEQQALKIRNAAKFTKDIEEAKVEVLPSRESQIRVFSKFKKDKEARLKIWNAAVEQAEKQAVQITAKLVETKARELYADKFTPTEEARKKAKKRIEGLKEILAYLEKSGMTDAVTLFKVEHGKDLDIPKEDRRPKEKVEA